MEKEHQIELSKILGIGDFKGTELEPANWSEIYVEIGRLIERANRPHKIQPDKDDKDYPNPFKPPYPVTCNNQ